MGIVLNASKKSSSSSKSKSSSSSSSSSKNGVVSTGLQAGSANSVALSKMGTGSTFSSVQNAPSSSSGGGSGGSSSSKSSSSSSPAPVVVAPPVVSPVLSAPVVYTQANPAPNGYFPGINEAVLSGAAPVPGASAGQPVDSLVTAIRYVNSGQGDFSTGGYSSGVSKSSSVVSEPIVEYVPVKQVYDINAASSMLLAGDPGTVASSLNPGVFLGREGERITPVASAMLPLTSSYESLVVKIQDKPVSYPVLVQPLSYGEIAKQVGESQKNYLEQNSQYPGQDYIAAFVEKGIDLGVAINNPVSTGNALINAFEQPKAAAAVTTSYFFGTLADASPLNAYPSSEKLTSGESVLSAPYNFVAQSPIIQNQFVNKFTTDVEGVGGKLIETGQFVENSNKGTEIVNILSGGTLVGVGALLQESVTKPVDFGKDVAEYAVIGAATGFVGGALAGGASKVALSRGGIAASEAALEGTNMALGLGGGALLVGSAIASKGDVEAQKDLYGSLFVGIPTGVLGAKAGYDYMEPFSVTRIDKVSSPTIGKVELEIPGYGATKPVYETVKGDYGFDVIQSKNVLGTLTVPTEKPGLLVIEGTVGAGKFIQTQPFSGEINAVMIEPELFTGTGKSTSQIVLPESVPFKTDFLNKLVLAGSKPVPVELRTIPLKETFDINLANINSRTFARGLTSSGEKFGYVTGESLVIVESSFSNPKKVSIEQLGDNSLITTTSDKTLTTSFEKFSVDGFTISSKGEFKPTASRALINLEGVSKSSVSEISTGPKAQVENVRLSDFKAPEVTFKVGEEIGASFIDRNTDSGDLISYGIKTKDVLGFTFSKSSGATPRSYISEDHLLNSDIKSIEQTYSHEQGHLFSYKKGLDSNNDFIKVSFVKAASRKELLRFYRSDITVDRTFAAVKSYAPEKRLGEFYADAFTAYKNEPDRLKSEFPTFYKYFDRVDTKFDVEVVKPGSVTLGYLSGSEVVKYRINDLGDSQTSLRYSKKVLSQTDYLAPKKVVEFSQLDAFINNIKNRRAIKDKYNNEVVPIKEGPVFTKEFTASQTAKQLAIEAKKIRENELLKISQDAVANKQVVPSVTNKDLSIVSSKSSDAVAPSSSGSYKALTLLQTITSNSKNNVFVDANTVFTVPKPPVTKAFNSLLGGLSSGSVASIIKGLSSSKQSQSTRQVQRSQSASRTSIRSATRLVNDIKIDTKQDLRVTPLYRADLRTTTRTDTRGVVKPIIPPDIKPPEFPTKFSFPYIPFGGFSGFKSSRNTSSKAKFKYSRGITANFFGIKNKASRKKVFSGLEVRG